MKLFLTDIKKIDWLYSMIGSYAPTFPLLTTRSGEYHVVYYDYDDKNSILVILGSQNFVTINESIYRGQMKFESQNVGVLREPFDTSNLFFYSYLRTAAHNVFSDITEREKMLEQLKALFLDFMMKDKRALDSSAAGTLNAYPVTNASSVETALFRLMLNKKVVPGMMKVTMLLDNYFSQKGKSFLGNHLKSIVKAIPNVNGGLIPEANGKMRYMIIGEIGAAHAGDTSIGKAKEMLRSGIDSKKIQLETGWFFNLKDNKWRKKISDAGSSVAGSIKFYDERSDSTYTLVPDKKVPPNEIIDLFNEETTILKLQTGGYSLSVLDVISHPLLGKYYPELKNVLMVFGGFVSNRKKTFYNTNQPISHIIIYGDPDNDSLSTISLHEIQHAIQKIEGFGNGGNPSFAELIVSVGGSSVKKYFFSLSELKKEFCKNVPTMNFRDMNAFINRIPELMPKDSEEDFINQTSKYCSELASKFPDQESFEQDCEELYFSLMQVLSISGAIDNAEASNFISDHFGSRTLELFTYSRKMRIETEAKSDMLMRQGWTREDLRVLFFNVYKNLMGEIESREVQQTTQVPMELLSYFDYYSSETIDPKYVNVVVEGSSTEEPLNPAAGIETIGTDEKSYIIHLRSGISPEPYLHELGHVLFDVVQEDHLPELIAAYASYKNKYPDIDEFFVACFLSYVKKKNIDQDLTDALSKSSSDMSLNYFENIFEELLFSKKIINEAVLKQQLSFVNQLMVA